MNYKNVTQRHEVSKCYWKNGTNRLTQHRVSTNLQFVKNAISEKCNTAKQNKTRYACIYLIDLNTKMAPIDLLNTGFPIFGGKIGVK